MRARLPAIETAVAEGRLAATLAVEQIAAMLRLEPRLPVFTSALVEYARDRENCPAKAGLRD